MVIGPQTYHRLPEMIAGRARNGATGGRDRVSRSKTSSTPCQTREADARGDRLPHVQEGCDKFCTFCVVPYTRGAELPPCR
jgi:tRNA-2-methylthio-N6-dimethylallyladenosine synthase